MKNICITYKLVLGLKFGMAYYMQTISLFFATYLIKKLKRLYHNGIAKFHMQIKNYLSVFGCCFVAYISLYL